MRDFSAENLHQATVYDNDGDKVGKVGQIYVVDGTSKPSWVSVNTGLFGTNESLIPLESARMEGDKMHVPFDKKTIKDAPNFDTSTDLSTEDEDRLYRHYGMAGTTTGTQGHTGTTGAAGAAGHGDREHVGTDRDRPHGEHDRDRTHGEHDRDRTHGEHDDEATMVRREEELNVGKKTETAGRARLRKRVVTDTEHVEVPVKREELRVERESLSDHEARDAGPIGGDSDETITLREERAVVGKETVGKEKVTVGKETVHDTEHVSEEVQKEEFDIDTDGKAGHGRDRNRDRDDR